MKRHLLVPALAAMILAAAAAEKPRVYITESGSLQMSGTAALGDTKGSLDVHGGTSSENIEVMKAFQRRCPEVVVTGNRDKADFIVRFDREEPSPITPFVRGNKVAVFNKDDELIHSNSTRFLNSAVKGACEAIAPRRSTR